MEKRIGLLVEVLSETLEVENELQKKLKKQEYSNESCYSQNQILREHISAGLQREQDLKQKIVSLEIELKKRGG